jgi:hypothetical protein
LPSDLLLPEIFTNPLSIRELTISLELTPRICSISGLEIGCLYAIIERDSSDA